MKNVNAHPFISVVIPLYNKENYVEDTLQSVLNQSYKDFEIVIINDGSTDRSVTIAELYLSTFKNKTILTQKNKGLSATRNRGIKLAKGDIIAFLDADDIWEKDFLNCIVALYKKFPSVNVYGTYYNEYYSDDICLKPKVNLPKSLQTKSFVIEDFFKANLGQPIVSQSSFAAKKSVFEELKFDETIDYAEDIDFYINCFTTHNLAYAYDSKIKVRINALNQMTQLGISGKNIPNFEKYMGNADESLSKYLSFYSYSFALQYKYLDDKTNFDRLKSIVNNNSLNWKQRALLDMPRFLYVLLNNLKSYLTSKGIKLTSY